MSEEKPLDPLKTICVCYHDGKEVGRIAAAAKNAADYMDTLARHHGSLEIKYETNETYAMVDCMVRGTNPRAYAPRSPVVHQNRR